MNARLRAFQDALGDRKPRFFKERMEPEARTMSPSRRKTIQRIFDITNIRLRENKSPSVEKISESKHIERQSSGFDLNVLRVMKSPASEQRFTPLREAFNNEEIKVKMRHESIDNLFQKPDNDEKKLNKYESNMQVTFSNPKLAECEP